MIRVYLQLAAERPFLHMGLAWQEKQWGPYEGSAPVLAKSERQGTDFSGFCDQPHISLPWNLKVKPHNVHPGHHSVT